MTKPGLVESRFDFRGGLNTVVTRDLLNADELIDATNVRIDQSGGITKRSGTRYAHQTALPAAILGLTQWQSPGGPEIVAISNGSLYHKTTEFGAFSAAVTPGVPFSTTLPTYFATFRAAAPGAPIVLYMASAGNVYKWDGTTLTNITGVNNVPAASYLASYQTRMFYAGISTLKKQLYWSRVGDAEYCTTGTGSDGGSALVDLQASEAITGLKQNQGSLIITGDDSITRLTGTDNSNIQIDSEVAGISSEVGVLASQSLLRVEQVVYILTNRGPYLVMEAGVVPVCPKIETAFTLGANEQYLTNAVFGHNASKKEVLFFVAAFGAVTNQTAYVYNYRTQSCTGPWNFGFDVKCASKFEQDTGKDILMVGCADGFVRYFTDLSTEAKDNVAFDGTGGSAVQFTAEFAPLVFNDAGPGMIKNLDRLAVQALALAGSQVVIEVFEDSSVTPDSTSLNQYTAYNTVTTSYRVDIDAQARRFRVRISDLSSAVPMIDGWVAYGNAMLRK